MKLAELTQSDLDWLNFGADNFSASTPDQFSGPAMSAGAQSSSSWNWDSVANAAKAILTPIAQYKIATNPQSGGVPQYYRTSQGQYINPQTGMVIQQPYQSQQSQPDNMLLLAGAGLVAWFLLKD